MLPPARLWNLLRRLFWRFRSLISLTLNHRLKVYICHGGCCCHVWFLLCGSQVRPSCALVEWIELHECVVLSASVEIVCVMMMIVFVGVTMEEVEVVVWVHFNARAYPPLSLPGPQVPLHRMQ